MSNIDHVTLPNGTTYGLGGGEQGSLQYSDLNIQEFDSTYNYNVYDLVHYNDKYYYCSNPYYTPGPFYNGSFTQISLDKIILYTLAKNTYDYPFSDSKQFYRGDVIEYNNNIYEVINNHLGNWNDSDFQLFITPNASVKILVYRMNLACKGPVMYPSFESTENYSEGDIVRIKGNIYAKFLSDYTANDPSTYNIEYAQVTDIINESMSKQSYLNLLNKPSINGVTLTGNKTSSDLGLNNDGIIVRDYEINKNYDSHYFAVDYYDFIFIFRLEYDNKYYVATQGISYLELNGQESKILYTLIPMHGTPEHIIDDEYYTWDISSKPEYAVYLQVNFGSYDRVFFNFFILKYKETVNNVDRYYTSTESFDTNPKVNYTVIGSKL